MALARTIIGIGASAGGVESIIDLLAHLPNDLPAAVLVVLHRSPDLPSRLKEILQRRSGIPIQQVSEDMPLKAGFCFVSPPDFHMMLTPERRIHLVADGFYRGNNIDLLFNSLARCAGADSIGVVLSGLLKDGTLGLRAIKEAGGTALVQSPEEAAFSDMPRNAIVSDGPVDLVGTVRELAEEISRRCKLPASAR